MSRIDITGNRYGRLKVINYAYSAKNQRHWVCLCDCGNITLPTTNSLKKGNTTSCGCRARELTKKFNHDRRKYKMEYEKNRPVLYYTWLNMCRRCNNPKMPDYYRYGGRGIKVCDEWLDYSTFEEWAMNSGWEKGLTLDRIDNEGNYFPENCRWATRDQQANNKRTCIFLTYNGKTQTMAQWARECGVSSTTISNRYHAGWDAERIITTPVKKKSL